MPKELKERPNDGGSYRCNKNGTYTRLGKPQKPDPGKSVRRKRAEKAGQDAGKSAAKDSKSGSNVSQLPPKGEKE